jgi:hypothetical protein
MLWKLFRPRPIVKITVPGEVIADADKMLVDRFNKEYVVVVGFDPNASQINIEIIK